MKRQLEHENRRLGVPMTAPAGAVADLTSSAVLELPLATAAALDSAVFARVPEGLMEMSIATAKRTPGKQVFLPCQNLFRHVDRILAEAGIEKLDVLGRKVTAHSFRHSWAALRAHAVGNNPFLLKTLPGHTPITTTDR